MSIALIFPLILIASSRTLVVLAQTCDSATVSEVIFTDFTAGSAFTGTVTIDGDAAVDSTGTRLTTTDGNSAGGFFFNTATDFQGPGGFSVKFSLQSTDTSVGVGDVWEFIVAASTNRDIVSPPYTSGSSSNGLSGWSRLNALVVEFDSVNSGTENQDESANHIAVFLAGRKACTQDISASLGNGDKFTIWVDYNGFNTSAQIRVSEGDSDSRPANPTMNCVVDIWSTMDISTSNHIGFMAYNPSSGGAEHRIVDSISVADAYRPYDSEDCAAYGPCAQKSGTDILCLQSTGSTTCSLNSCDAGYVWDLSGTDCCAFIEKGTWSLADSAGSGPFFNGESVDCEQIRRTIAFPTDASNCS